MENIIDLIPVDALAAAVLVLLAAVTLYLLVQFLRRPRAEKLAAVQEWLLWAVATAESCLGGGQGARKLSLVYDWFVMRFPLMAAVIGFEQFQKMVDDALEQLKTLLLDDAIMDMIIKEEIQNEHETHQL